MNLKPYIADDFQEWSTGECDDCDELTRVKLFFIEGLDVPDPTVWLCESCRDRLSEPGAEPNTG